MNKKHKASVSNVGQDPKGTKTNRPLRTVKISGRLSAKVAAAKPPGVSWGDYIERLQSTRDKRDPQAPERTRYFAWAAISLDRLALQAETYFPDRPSLTFEERLSRLEALAKFIDGIRALRADLEKILYAG